MDTETIASNGGRAGLSVRELQILQLIGRGMSNREVAETLHLSPNTVKTHVATGYRKIGVSSRSQAVLWALTNGLIQDIYTPPESGPGVD